jgi:hypothetical protein
MDYDVGRDRQKIVKKGDLFKGWMNAGGRK